MVVCIMVVCIMVEDQMRVTPLNDRIVVRQEEAKDRTDGGIILPDTAKEKPRKGKVVAVGCGRLLENGVRRPLSVKEGDTVLFNSYAGSKVDVDGQELLVVTEDNVLAVIN